MGGKEKISKGHAGCDFLAENEVLPKKIGFGTGKSRNLLSIFSAGIHEVFNKRAAKGERYVWAGVPGPP